MRERKRPDELRIEDPAKAFQRVGKKLDLKPSAFARAAEVSWPTAKAWFTGTTSPTLVQLDKLIAGLQSKGHAVTVADFLTTRRAA